ncbi:MAG TPA: hypothetical protein VG457_13650 [Planctomycetota bacterium]|jgi:hypothetical protein|nr:hypothetical protein [Planctomycetota bacterium]
MLTESPDFGDAYRSWSNCGLGSSVTTEDRREIAPGMTMISSTSLTLCALDAEKATLDMVVRNRIEGGPIEFPPTEILQEIEIPAIRPPASSEEDPSGFEANADGSWGIWEVTHDPPETESPDFAQKKGEEMLAIAGRSVTCRWIERTTEVGGRRLIFKVWLSDQIPGGRARAEVRGDGDAPPALTTVVVSFMKK